MTAIKLSNFLSVQKQELNNGTQAKTIGTDSKGYIGASDILETLKMPLTEKYIETVRNFNENSNIPTDSDFDIELTKGTFEEKSTLENHLKTIKAHLIELEKHMTSFHGENGSDVITPEYVDNLDIDSL